MIKRYPCAYLSVLLVLALFVQGLIPAGFMPGQGRNGEAKIIICGGQASRDHEPASDRRDPGHSCPYAPVLAQDMPAPPAPALTVPVYADAAPEKVTGTPPQAEIRKPWLSRGPPPPA